MLLVADAACADVVVVLWSESRVGESVEQLDIMKRLAQSREVLAV